MIELAKTFLIGMAIVIGCNAIADAISSFQLNVTINRHVDRMPVVSGGPKES